MWWGFVRVRAAPSIRRDSGRRRRYCPRALVLDRRLGVLGCGCDPGLICHAWPARALVVPAMCRGLADQRAQLRDAARLAPESDVLALGNQSCLRLSAPPSPLRASPSKYPALHRDCRDVASPVLRAGPPRHVSGTDRLWSVRRVVLGFPPAIRRQSAARRPVIPHPAPFHVHPCQTRSARPAAASSRHRDHS